MKKNFAVFITLCVMAVLLLVETTGGSKTVKAENTVIGDLNSDNDVGTDDMNILCKYLAGQAGSIGTDVNGDTAVDVRDLVRYRRYLTEPSDTLSGKGTSDEPYLISSLPDMYKFINDSQEDMLSGTYYQVTEDIVVNLEKAASLDPNKVLIRGWETIGTSVAPFNGTLDGSGKTISGIYLNDATVTGFTNLFGYTGEDGTVTALNVDNSNMTLAEVATTGAKHEHATITNSEIQGCDASITGLNDKVYYGAFKDAVTAANNGPASATNTATEATMTPVQAGLAGSTAFLTVAGDYTNEGFEFTTRFNDGKEWLFAGARLKTDTIGQDLYDARGIIVEMRYDKIYFNSPRWSSNHHREGTVKFPKPLSIGKDYTFTIWVTDGSEADTYNVVVQVKDGDTIYATVNFETMATKEPTLGGGTLAASEVQSSGSFAVWSLQSRNISWRITDSQSVNIVLLRDVTLTEKSEVTGNIIINNTPGQNVSIYRGANCELLRVRPGGELKLFAKRDGAEGQLIIDGSGYTSAATANMIVVETGASFFMGEHVTIQNVNANKSGGAIYSSGTAMLYGDMKDNKNAQQGGAVRNDGGTLTVINGTYSNNVCNKASNGGAAIYSKGGTVTIIDATFENNKAEAGGAIHVEGGAVTLRGVTMTGNKGTNSTMGGGALYLKANAAVSIENCTIKNNWTETSTGASLYDIAFAHDTTCTLTLLDTSFIGLLGCYSSSTGSSSSQIVYNDKNLTMAYNTRYQVNYVDEILQKGALYTPDYSDSQKELYIYAHRSTSKGTFTDLDGNPLVYEDYTTKERFQEYKDCGFNVLYIQEERYNGETFKTSYIKKCLDLAQEVGLKCIIMDQRIRFLSSHKVSLIGEGAQFATMQDLAKKVSDYMAPYINHPAFFGIALLDEPKYEVLEATGQVYQALKMAKSDLFVKVTLLPFQPANPVSAYIGGTSSGQSSINDYSTYINKFMQASNGGLLSYDDYPFRHNQNMMITYFCTLQTVVETATQYGTDAELVVQSFAKNNRRLPDLNELYLQNNAALAFGVKNIGYFTYWRASGDYITAGILDFDGTKMIYDEVQEVIAYTREMANVILNFDYEKAYVAGGDKASDDIFWQVKSQQLDELTVESVTQPTIVTQMKDETNNRTGYMVVNVQSSVTGVSEAEEVVLKFDGYDFATCYMGDVSKIVPLEDGKITFTLEEGHGVFVIPHN